MSKNNQINSREISEKDQVVVSADQNEINRNQAIPVTDPEVKQKRTYAPRRTYDNAYKARILATFDAFDNPKARSAFLRQEGLYYSRITAWKREQEMVKSKKSKQAKSQPRIDHLAREVAQLKKKLAQAEAIIALQKKVSELLGTHILPHESSEVIS